MGQEILVLIADVQSLLSNPHRLTQRARGLNFGPRHPYLDAFSMQEVKALAKLRITQAHLALPCSPMQYQNLH